MGSQGTITVAPRWFRPVLGSHIPSLDKRSRIPAASGARGPDRVAPGAPDRFRAKCRGNRAGEHGGLLGAGLPRPRIGTGRERAPLARPQLLKHEFNQRAPTHSGKVSERVYTAGELTRLAARAAGLGALRDNAVVQAKEILLSLDDADALLL
jgi:hypothetical protein